jgi:hypothetical protein
VNTYPYTARNVVHLGTGPYPARPYTLPNGQTDPTWWLVQAPSPSTGELVEHARHNSELILRRND